MQVITLTTDFGTRDWFVGTMKGVILSVNPRASVVDLTHEIPGSDIRAGAFALMASCRFFPKGTVHVAVIDPGVGGQRKAIAVKTRDYFFVGPDNGVLSFALAQEQIRAVHALTNEDFFLQPISSTFHGRDIFAPVAAHLSKGLPIQKLGPPLKSFTRLTWPQPRFSPNQIRGEIIYCDRFGNAITNLRLEDLPETTRTSWQIQFKRQRVCPLAAFYQAVPIGKPVAIVGSSGLIEIAVNGGSAAEMFRLKVGNPLTACPAI
jgi:S-adenosylmethionine hydrolase